MPLSRSLALPLLAAAAALAPAASEASLWQRGQRLLSRSLLQDVADDQGFADAAAANPGVSPEMLVGEWDCNGVDTLTADVIKAMNEAGGADSPTLGAPGSDAWTSLLSDAGIALNNKRWIFHAFYWLDTPTPKSQGYFIFEFARALNEDPSFAEQFPNSLPTRNGTSAASEVTVGTAVRSPLPIGVLGAESWGHYTITSPNTLDNGVFTFAFLGDADTFYAQGLEAGFLGADGSSVFEAAFPSVNFSPASSMWTCNRVGGAAPAPAPAAASSDADAVEALTSVQYVEAAASENGAP